MLKHGPVVPMMCSTVEHGAGAGGYQGESSWEKASVMYFKDILMVHRLKERNRATSR